MILKSPPCSQSEIQSKAKAFLAEHGLTPPETVIFDGKIKRIPVEGKSLKNKDGSYVGHDNGSCLILSVWNWPLYGDQTQTTVIGNGKPLSHKQRVQLDREIENGRRIAEKKQAAGYEQAAREALRVSKTKVVPAISNHPYLKRKGVVAHDISQMGKYLIIFGKDEHGNILNYQRITPDGEKKFQPYGCRSRGTSHLIPGDGKNYTLHSCEGYGTGASIHKATGGSVRVCFDAHNLPVVTEAYLKKRPPEPGEAIILVICGDNDEWTYVWVENGKEKHGKKPPEGVNATPFKRVLNPPEGKPWQGNTGKIKALKAAEIAGKVPGVVPVVVFPEFKNPGPDKSDFNDLHQEQGIEEVRRQIDMAVKAAVNGSRHHSVEVKEDNRPKPMPLIRTPPQEPYPINCLPPVIKASVEKMHEYTHAHIPLIVASHMSYLSLVTQSLAMVRRDEQLVGPISSYYITIAPLNSCKTTCDGFLSTTVNAFVKDKKEKMHDKLSIYKAECATLESQINGLLAKIKRDTAKRGNPEDAKDTAKKLTELQKKVIKPVLVPNYTATSITRQKMVKMLAQEWPSIGIVTDEGGILFGSFAMNSEQIMGTISILNSTWSGSAPDSGTVGEGYYKAHGAKITMGVQVQPEPFSMFLDKNLLLLKSSGFLARTFIAEVPPIPKGKKYTSPGKLAEVAAFNKSLLKLLEREQPFDRNMILSPPSMPLSKEAKKLWIDHVDEVGALDEDVNEYEKGLAGKAPEHASRVAAQFELFKDAFTSNPNKEVSKESYESAKTHVSYYTREQKRYFGKVDLSQEQKDAIKVDDWLRRETTKTGIPVVGKARVGDYTNIKPAKRLDAALAYLEERNRISIRNGKGRAINIEYLVKG